MNMKIFTMLGLSLLLIIGVILTVGCAAEAPTLIIEDVTAQEAFNMIQDNLDNPNFIIVDVRTPEEYAEGHVEKAINIDFRSENFRDEIDKLNKDKTYLIYCHSGRRSADALDIMKELDFTRIYHMNGGILEWLDEELPTVK